MKQAMADVIAFMRAMGQEVPDEPTIEVPSKTVNLRLDLITEELYELDAAMCKKDIGEVADACADLIYVTIGCAAAYGIDLAEVWKRVHARNMAKLKGEVRSDGKRLKPADWVPPDVLGAIATQKPLSELYPTTNDGR